MVRWCPTARVRQAPPARAPNIWRAPRFVALTSHAVEVKALHEDTMRRHPIHRPAPRLHAHAARALPLPSSWPQCHAARTRRAPHSEEYTCRCPVSAHACRMLTRPYEHRYTSPIVVVCLCSRCPSPCHHGRTHTSPARPFRTGQGRRAGSRIHAHALWRLAGHVVDDGPASKVTRLVRVPSREQPASQWLVSSRGRRENCKDTTYRFPANRTSPPTRH